MELNGAMKQLSLLRPPGCRAGERRLAELVTHLTGCAATTAVDAVGHALPGGTLSFDDRLAVVARAMVAIRHDRRGHDPGALRTA
jgi:hypothetical protein